MLRQPIQSIPGKPANIIIYAVQNDTFLYEITAVDENNDPYDFSGATFEMEVKDAIEGTQQVDITNDSVTITADIEGTAAGVSNVVQIQHTESDMDFAAGEYVYDIEMTRSDGAVITIQKGTFIMQGDVTNSP